MARRCLTCDILLEETTGNSMSSVLLECKNCNLGQIFEDCIGMEAAINEVVCDGCKVQLILFYQFKLKVVAVKVSRLKERREVEKTEINEEIGTKDVDLVVEKDTQDIKSGSSEPMKKLRKKKRQEFSCSDCSFTFLHRSALKTHQLGLHSNVESLTCIDCNKLFESQEALKQHRTSIHTVKSFVCHICGSRFSKGSRLRFHIKSKHENPESVKVKPKMIACDICQKILSNRSIQHHKAAIHKIGRIKLPFTCQICDSHWPSKTSLQTHHLTKHTTERNFKCAVCGRAFATKPLLVSHINRIHCSTKNFICDTCGKAFKTQTYLNNHRLVHSTKKAFICTDCGASFKHEASLCTHTKIHREKSSGVNYLCKICNLAFATARTLKKHEMSHSGPDLICDHCGKKYKQKESLTKHILSVHERIKMRVTCRLCAKVLWNRKVMRIHVQEIHGDILKADPEKNVDDYLENTQITKETSNKNNYKTEEKNFQIISVQILNT